MIQCFIFLDNDYDESDGSGGSGGSDSSLFDLSSIGLLGYATRMIFLGHDSADLPLKRHSIVEQHLSEWTDVYKIERDKNGN